MCTIHCKQTCNYIKRFSTKTIDFVRRKSFVLIIYGLIATDLRVLNGLLLKGGIINEVNKFVSSEQKMLNEENFTRSIKEYTKNSNGEFTHAIITCILARIKFYILISVNIVQRAQCTL